MNIPMPTDKTALPGRQTAMPVSNQHFIHQHPLQPPFPEAMQQAVFGMGCFWGAEKCFWTQQGVFSTAVGYAGGFTQNPTYQEVCSGQTGHNEVVLVIFEPEVISYRQLLKIFWENHDPTQGMRQGNDRGTQYRSGVYTCSETQQQQAEQSRKEYQQALRQNHRGDITTEIKSLVDFYYAEEYHQQYLGKNPHGYCGLGGTGIKCLSQE